MKFNENSRKIIHKARKTPGQPSVRWKSPSTSNDSSANEITSSGERAARSSPAHGRWQVPAPSTSSSPNPIISAPLKSVSAGQQHPKVKRTTRRFMVEHNKYYEYGYFHSRHPDRVTRPYPLAPGTTLPILGDIYVHERAPAGAKFKPYTLHAFQAFYWSSANTWKQIRPERMTQENGGYFHPNRISYPMVRLAYVDIGKYILTWVMLPTAAKALKLLGREYRQDPPIPKQPDPNNFDDLEEEPAGGEKRKRVDDDEYSSVDDEEVMEQTGEFDEEIIPSSERGMEISSEELYWSGDVPMNVDHEPVVPVEVKDPEPKPEPELEPVPVPEPEPDGAGHNVQPQVIQDESHDVQPQDMDDDNGGRKKTLEDFQTWIDGIAPYQSDWATEWETAHEATDETPSIHGVMNERNAAQFSPVIEEPRYRTPDPSVLMDHDVHRPVIVLPPKKRLKTSRNCLGWLL